MINSPAELEQLRQDILTKRSSETTRISVCAGAGCLATGARKVIDAFNSEIEKEGLAGDVCVKGTGCPGFCERGPIVVIDPEQTCYLQVTAQDVPEIVAESVKQKKVVNRLLYTDAANNQKASHARPTSRSTNIRNGTSSATTSRSIRSASTTIWRLAAIRRSPRLCFR